MGSNAGINKCINLKSNGKNKLKGIQMQKKVNESE